MICAILTNELDYCQPPLFPALTSNWFKRDCHLANVLIANKFLDKIGLIFSSEQTAYLLNVIASTSSYLLDWVSQLVGNVFRFLATLVALHFTPVSK